MAGDQMTERRDLVSTIFSLTHLVANNSPRLIAELDPLLQPHGSVLSATFGVGNARSGEVRASPRDVRAAAVPSGDPFKSRPFTAQRPESLAPGLDMYQSQLARRLTRMNRRTHRIAGRQGGGCQLLGSDARRERRFSPGLAHRWVKANVGCPFREALGQLVRIGSSYAAVALVESMEPARIGDQARSLVNRHRDHSLSFRAGERQPSDIERLSSTRGCPPIDHSPL